MKKMLYISFYTFQESDGIVKKIKGQIKGFKDQGLEVDLLYPEIKEIFFNGEKIGKFYTESRHEKKITLMFKYYNFIKKHTNNYDFIYIRNPQSIDFITYYKLLKFFNNKVIVEIPTYPYGKEAKGLQHQILLFFDKISRIYLKNYVDLITYMGEKNEIIWGIPALKIENAIDIDTIPLKKMLNNEKQINFIGVAGLAPWHGYDRLIKSMGILDDEVKEKIYFHVVGEGSVWQELKDLTKRLKLEKHVIFYGKKSGKELDEIFDRCDIGVSCLGLFRKGMEEVSDLKSREYCARGLPFISGNIDPMFENKSFRFRLKNDESIFSLDEIIKWYYKLNITGKELRNYAEKNSTWSTQITEIVKKIKEL